MIGIYKITNKVNNKIYIGSSINIEYRFYEHKIKLKSNSHINKHLQSTYNKYGKDNFSFEILKITSKEILRRAEQFYINKYKVLDPKFGYNKAVVQANYNDKNNNQISIKKNTIYFGCYSKKGKLVKVFRIIKDVYIFLGKRVTRIYDSCNSNLTKSSNGYYWIKHDVSKSHFPLFIKIKPRKGRHRKIIQCSINDDTIKEFNSATEAAKELNISSFNITRCLRKNNLYKNYKWYYSAP